MEPQSIGKEAGAQVRSDERGSAPSQSTGATKDSSGRTKKKKENTRSLGAAAASGGQRPGAGNQEGPGNQEMAGKQEVSDLRLHVERLQEMIVGLQERLDLQETLLKQAVPNLQGAEKSTSVKTQEVHIGAKDGSVVSPQAESAGEPLVSERVADAGGDVENPPEKQDVSRRHMFRRNMTTGHFDSLVENKVGWEVTIWDISFFIGMPELEVAGSIFTFLVLLLNLIIQFVFLNIVEQSFTTSSFSESTIAAFKKWRLNFGHDASHLDSSFVSLASRLCSEDKSLEMSGQQASALTLIQNYLPTDESKHLVMFGSQVGPVFCILCITLWVLTTTAELQRIVQQCRALLMLPRTHGIQSGTVLKQKPKGGWTLVSLCPTRIGIFFVVQLFRTAICLLLTRAGIQFLVYTTSLRELVLKAVGLRFVLTVDELLAQALAPAQAVMFVKLLDPMKGPKRVTWHGLDRRTFFTAIGVAILLGTVVPLWIAPEVSRMEQARDALCAGETQFVTTPTTYPPYTWWAISEEPDTEAISRDAGSVWESADDAQGDDFRFRHGMTARIIKSDLADEAVDMKNPNILGAAWSLKAMESWSVSKGVNRFNLRCEDGSDFGDIKHAPKWYQSSLDDFFEGKVRSCEAASEYCHNDTAAGVCARSWCPVTCGCRSPSSNLILKDSESGCPTHCKDHPSYVAELESASCEERAPEVITEANDWKAFIENLELAATDWPPGGKLFGQMIRDAMGAYGCGAVAVVMSSAKFDLCKEGDTYKPVPMKTLRFMCPQTCNCTPDMFDCPSSAPC